MREAWTNGRRRRLSRGRCAGLEVEHPASLQFCEEKEIVRIENARRQTVPSARSDGTTSGTRVALYTAFLTPFPILAHPLRTRKRKLSGPAKIRPDLFEIRFSFGLQATYASFSIEWKWCRTTKETRVAYRFARQVKSFPAAVQRKLGFALYQAQIGQRHETPVAPWVETAVWQLEPMI